MNIIIKKTISKVTTSAKSLYCIALNQPVDRISFKFDKFLSCKSSNSNKPFDDALSNDEKYKNEQLDKQGKILRNGPKIFRQTTIQFPKKRVHMSYPYSKQTSNPRQLKMIVQEMDDYSKQTSNARQLNVIVQEMDDPYFCMTL